MHRRQVLASSALLGVSALAGCSSVFRSPGLAQLALSGDVLRQPTNEHPGQVRATLSTTANDAVTVRMGPALVLTAPDGPDASVLLAPHSSVGDVPEGVRTDSGCWRVPDDEPMAVRSVLKSYDVRPGNPITETYDVYTRGMQTACLPAGTHRFEDAVSGADESSEADLRLVLEISPDGRLSIAEEQTGVWSVD